MDNHAELFAALRAVIKVELRRVLEKGFDLGFSVSAEGWNGEYGCKYWKTDGTPVEPRYMKWKQHMVDEAMKEMES